MLLRGQLIAESPIYRGNARKTLFTRDGDGTHRLVSLPGEIAGTAQSLMDAFIGQSHNGKNRGLLNEAWERLYNVPIPSGLIQQVDCKLQARSYQREAFFDLRMGIKLNEDRWAAEANANYKMETVFRNSVFDFVLSVKDAAIAEDENKARLFYLLQEMKEGRFWFGAGKSKGLGNLRLEIDLPFSEPAKAPPLRRGINHLRLDLVFDATNPVFVGWNWGKIDPEAAAFVALEGRQLIGALKSLPDPIRDRLDMALGGPLFDPDDWKKKFAEYLPRAIAIWLKERSSGERTAWTLPSSELAKLSKGKHALAPKLLSKIEPLSQQSFSTRDEAEAAIKEALGKKANMANRLTSVLEERREDRQQFDKKAWQQIADALGMPQVPPEDVVAHIGDEAMVSKSLEPLCAAAIGPFYRQIDQQIKLIQSDSWVDVEIKNREEHALIKKMLLEGKILESQWQRPDLAPEGVSPIAWREFLDAHSKVQYRHMLNESNLRKSITNDNNLIEFLEAYRDQTRQELSQTHHIDFRAGGPFNREISRAYGKPYDNMFMRMLTWAPSSSDAGTWEIYIPGSTLKGAFRKRASQILKTLMGESAKTDRMIDLLFGTQGQRGKVFFSDAYLTDPIDADKEWCSMDGIRIDPKTARPIEAAKHNYLFAYGDRLKFHFRMDIQDIREGDLEIVSLLWHLVRDFQGGDIPIGGEKTNGFGWVHATVNQVSYLTSDPDTITERLFGKRPLARHGVWHEIKIEGPQAAEALKPLQTFSKPQSDPGKAVPPPFAQAGFISHRSFGGRCGLLQVEVETLSPLSIQESGAPSRTKRIDDAPINGWDFFSFSPPDPLHRGPNRVYALPSRSIKGAIRLIYAAASDSRINSPDISRLNPADSLFGWVGKGPNNALAGRVSFSFGAFDRPKLNWFEAPYPYGDWQYTGTAWQKIKDESAKKLVVNHSWRIFPHTPLAPVVKRLEEFDPKSPSASYFRAVMPGCKARFTIRFWNLLDDELQRLLWCVALEPGLAHKMGNHRYLGFGSLRMKIESTSFLIKWSDRYAGASEADWQAPLIVDDWINPKVISNHSALRKALNADCL